MRSSRIFLLIAAAFLARLAFGLAGELFGPDESQIFLIGLQYFTTGHWPYFGPDVVYTRTQIPGGLQGLLIGGPLFIAPIPEAPYVVLNLISIAALTLLAWYIGRRLPSLPRWFLWPWVFFSPWTLSYSTHIINTSYVLAGAIVFFVSAFELVPRLRIGALKPAAAWFGLGAGLLWIAQLHLSSVLLAALVGLVMLLVARDDVRRFLHGLPWFALGAAVTGATLVPTLLHGGGPGTLTTSTGANVGFHPGVLLSLPLLAARFFSFGSFELARFVGANTDERLAFLAAYPWAAPFALVAGAIGIAQTAVLFTGAFWRRTLEPDWPAVRNATLATLGFICAAFAFSIKGPASHTIYSFAPLVVIYACYCWAPILRRPAGRRIAIALLVAGCVAQVALGVRNFGLRSLYTNRSLVVRAIQEKNYHLVGERRPDIWRAEGR